MRLLEQTISELRQQLAGRPTVLKPAQSQEREVGDSKPPRRMSNRGIPKVDSPAVAELRASLEARQRDVEALIRERNDASSAAKQAQAELEKVRAEREQLRANASRGESAIEPMRVERDEARAKLRAVEKERDEARSTAAMLQSQMEADRVARAKLAAKPVVVERRPEPGHEVEAAKQRIEALERQLEELRTAWKRSDDRANALELKSRQGRNDTAIATVKAASDRAAELARLLESASEMLASAEPTRRP